MGIAQRCKDYKNGRFELCVIRSTEESTLEMISRFSLSSPILSMHH